MIKGFIPFTLVDFPGKVAASIFTVGCNFNCPWCQNRSLIDRDSLMTIGLKSFSLNKIESSIELIKNSDIGHQFRTTLVPELVEKSSMENFAHELDIEIHFQEYRSVSS